MKRYDDGLTRQQRQVARRLRAGLCVRCGKKRSRLYARLCRWCAAKARAHARVVMARARGVKPYSPHEPGGPGRPPFVVES